jgi:hypothetical protein
VLIKKNQSENNHSGVNRRGQSMNEPSRDIGNIGYTRQIMKITKAKNTKQIIKKMSNMNL